MKAAIVALAIYGHLAGCSTYRQSRTTAKVGGYTMIVGAAIAAIGGGVILTHGDGEEGPVYTAIGLGLLGLVIFTPGALIVSLGLIGMAKFDKSPPASRFRGNH